MASHTIVDFLTDLYESEQRDELCFLIAQQLDKSPLAERVTEEFSYVLKSLFKTIQFNQSTTHFEPGFLKRVVAYLFTRTGLTASVLPGWDNLSSRCTP